MLVFEQCSVLVRLRHGNNMSQFAFGLRPLCIHIQYYGLLGVFGSTKCSKNPKNTCGGTTHTSYCLGHTLCTYVLFCASKLLLFGALCASKNRTHKFMRPRLVPPHYDKIRKVIWLVDEMREKCKRLYDLGKFLIVDEMMIRYKCNLPNKAIFAK
jgi:hypothetical protein